MTLRTTNALRDRSQDLVQYSMLNHNVIIGYGNDQHVQSAIRSTVLRNADRV